MSKSANNLLFPPARAPAARTNQLISRELVGTSLGAKLGASGQVAAAAVAVAVAVAAVVAAAAQTKLQNGPWLYTLPPLPPYKLATHN